MLGWIKILLYIVSIRTGRWSLSLFELKWFVFDFFFFNPSLFSAEIFLFLKNADAQNWNDHNAWFVILSPLIHSIFLSIYLAISIYSNQWWNYHYNQKLDLITNYIVSSPAHLSVSIPHPKLTVNLNLELILPLSSFLHDLNIYMASEVAQW